MMPRGSQAPSSTHWSCGKGSPTAPLEPSDDLEAHTPERTTQHETSLAHHRKNHSKGARRPCKPSRQQLHLVLDRCPSAGKSVQCPLKSVRGLVFPSAIRRLLCAGYPELLRRHWRFWISIALWSSAAWLLSRASKSISRLLATSTSALSEAISACANINAEFASKASAAHLAASF